MMHYHTVLNRFRDLSDKDEGRNFTDIEEWDTKGLFTTDTLGLIY